MAWWPIIGVQGCWPALPGQQQSARSRWLLFVKSCNCFFSRFFSWAHRRLCFSLVFFGSLVPTAAALSCRNPPGCLCQRDARLLWIAAPQRQAASTKHKNKDKNTHAEWASREHSKERIHHLSFQNTCMIRCLLLVVTSLAGQHQRIG